ncbi:MAG TPA: ATP-binding protein [Tepidisphaeraceae bacterium]|nr:ATP-binding protein [Tepidisphaeraceae bacterium]
MRRRFETVVENLPFGVVVVEPGGRIVLTNQALTILVGHAPIPTRTVAEFAQWPMLRPDNTPLPPQEHPVARALAGELVQNQEVQYRRGDGRTIWIRASGIPVRDAAGAVTGAIGVAIDVDQEKRSELELRRLNETLEHRVAAETADRMKAEDSLRQSQKMEAIGQLTGGVAHDFNNLLQVVMGNLESLQRRAASSGAISAADLERLTENALSGARRAALLTQRLLAFSRRQPLEPRSLDANALISGTAELLRRTLGESIALESVLAGGLWRISADPNQLENALLNLAVNARDAMPNGGRLTIEAANVFLDEAYAAREQVSPGQYVMIAVSDTGTGMSAEVIGRAFEPFFTTKEVGQGTGLGLSQIYGFVKQSDGHVKIYSEPGDGTTIKLYLPRLHAAEAERETLIQPQPVGGALDEVILAVEDDPDVRVNTVGMLRELGYRVLEATDGHSALELLQRHPEVRLLFTDVGLPGGMNGRQLGDDARARCPDIRVLFTTGYARNAIVHQGRLDPGVALLVKPFTYAGLAAKLREMLDQTAIADAG